MKHRILCGFLVLGMAGPGMAQIFIQSAAAPINLAIGKDGGVSWGDCDGDGDLDLLQNSDDGTRLYQNNGGGTFVSVATFLGINNVTITERSVIWADIDNDGDLDFARNSARRVIVHRNTEGDCDGPWAVALDLDGFNNVGPNPIPDGHNTEGLGWMDFDTDGDLDLLIENHNHGLDIFANDGAGNFSHATPNGSLLGLPGSITGNGDFMALTDFDADGFGDILARKSDFADLFRNQTNGTFGQAVNIDIASNGNKGGVVFCDLDNDADFDFYWTDSGTNQFFQNTNNTPAGFTAAGISPTVAGDIDGVLCADLDNDSDMDLIVTSSGNDQIFLNDLNSGTGVFGGVSFTPLVNPTTVGAGNSEGVAGGDYDNDGDIDFYINRDGNANQLWQNDTNDTDYLMVRALHDVDGVAGGVTRDAIGATATILDCGLNRVSGVREVNGGRGHGSQDQLLMHFGLGNIRPFPFQGGLEKFIVRVRFPGGATVDRAFTYSDLSGYQLVEVLSTGHPGEDSCAQVPVRVASFAATLSGETVLVEWETEQEVTHAAFELLGVDALGKSSVDSELIPAQGGDTFESRRYQVRIPYQGQTEFRLQAIDLKGRREAHGPFKINQRYGAPVQRDLIDWQQVAVEIDSARASRASGAVQRMKLTTSEHGVQTISLSELQSAGLSIQTLDTLALSHQGQRVPTQIGVSGDSLTFISRPVTDLYDDDSIMFAEASGLGAQMINHRFEPALEGALSTHRRLTEFAPQNVYSFASPLADPWYAHRMIAFDEPVSLEVPFDLPGYTFDRPAQLRLTLWGGSDFEMAEDHQVEVRINGVLFETLRFDGITAQHLSLSLSPGILLAEGNQLGLRLPAELDVPFDAVHLEGFEVEYTAFNIADDSGFDVPLERLNPDEAALFNDGFDPLNCQANRCREVRISGLSSPSPAIYLESGQTVYRLEADAVTALPDGSHDLVVTVPLGGSGHLWVDSRSPQHALTLSSSEPGMLLPAGSLDYLVITHPMFEQALNPLIQARQAQGLTTAVFSLDAIVDQWGNGYRHPDAISRFIERLAQTHQVRYVLLVGADSYDYLNHTGLNSISLMPSHYVATSDLIRYAPTDQQHADLNRDGMPDLAIGRWPVHDLDELAQIMQATLALEGQGLDTLLKVTDKTDGLVDFERLSNDFTEQAPASLRQLALTADSQAIESTRSSLLNQMATESNLVSYFGHAGPTRWTFDPLLSNNHLLSGAQSNHPNVVIHWACWANYYANPASRGMGQSFLTAGPYQAAASLGGTTLTSAQSHVDMALIFFAELTDGDRLGDVWLRAQRELIRQRPNADQYLLDMSLLGDPAMRLPY